MAVENNIELVIRLDSNKILYEYIKNENDDQKEEYPDDYKENTIRIELRIARTFHKILNLLKIEKDLFQKEDFELLGEMLRKIFFGNVGRPVLEGMAYSFLKSTKGNPKCRIYLEFEKNSDLAILPWEYTIIKTDEDKSIYLAANKEANFDFMRRVDAKGNLRRIHTNKLCCVLIVSGIKNKEEEIPAVGDSEVQLVKDLFGNLKEKYPTQFDFQVLQNTAFENIKKDLDDAVSKFERIDGEIPPYVIHYLGHSSFDDNGGRIAFFRQDQNSHWIKDYEFAQVFDSLNLEFDAPKMFVLQACDSAKLSNYGLGRGVALSLVNQRIPAVIGMQNEVDVDTSTEFMEKFYEGLLSGSDVGEAVTNGRTYLGKGEQDKEGKYINKLSDWYRTNSFGSPVLFITTLRPIYFFEKKLTIPEDISEKYVFKKCSVCKNEFEVPASQTNCKVIIRDPGRPPRVCNGLLYETTFEKESDSGAISDVKISATTTGVPAAATS